MNYDIILECLQEQLEDLKTVLVKAEEYGTTDFASTTALESMKRHEAELLEEINYFQLLQKDSLQTT